MKNSFLGTLLKFFFQKKKPLLWIWVASLGLFTTIAFLAPKEYQSQATFQVDADKNSSLIGGVSEGLKMLDPGFHSSQGIGVELAILDSRQLAVNMINMFDLKTKYETKWEQLAIKMFKKHLIYQDLDDGIVQISFTYSTPDSSKIILDSVLSYLNQESIEYSTNKARLEFEFDRALVDSVYAQLDSLSQEWVLFMQKNKMVDINENVQLSLRNYAAIEQNLVELESQYQLSKIDNAIPPQEKENLHAQIELLESKKREILSGTGGGLGSSEEDPELSINYDSVPKLSAYEAKFELLTEKDKTVLKALIPQMEESHVRMVETTPVLNILDPSFVPPYKSGPKRILIIFVGTLLMGIFLTGLLVMIELYRNPMFEAYGLRRALRQARGLQ